MVELVLERVLKVADRLAGDLVPRRRCRVGQRGSFEDEPLVEVGCHPVGNLNRALGFVDER
jgi:hypothetical protein